MILQKKLAEPRFVPLAVEIIFCLAERRRDIPVQTFLSIL